MLYSKSYLLLGLVAGLAACSAEPLATAGAPSGLRVGLEASNTSEVLSKIDIAPVKNRVAQQVRNSLLFAMNGGKPDAVGTGNYDLVLDVTHRSQNVAVEANSLTATASRVIILVSYDLVDKSTKKVVAAGRRQSVASYDRTPQSFANQRALRDAQDRAAREVAQQLRLAVAQDIASL
ncbi:MAG: LPS assembly lipoprotein LptE [Pseudomonadota bacterium]